MINSKIKLISLIGRPGSGKTTVGKFLTSDFGYPRFSAGDLFRKVANEDSEVGKIVRHIVENRLLTPPEVALPIIQNEVTRISKNAPIIIMDGYPRNLGQLEVAKRIESEIYFVDIEVSEIVCRKRIESASDRGDRLDDKDKKVFNQGFLTYTNQTVPMIDLVESKNPNHFFRINGEDTPKKIAEKINLGITSL